MADSLMQSVFDDDTLAKREQKDATKGPKLSDSVQQMAQVMMYGAVGQVADNQKAIGEQTMGAAKSKSNEKAKEHASAVNHKSETVRERVAVDDSLDKLYQEEQQAMAKASGQDMSL